MRLVFLQLTLWIGSIVLSSCQNDGGFSSSDTKSKHQELKEQTDDTEQTEPEIEQLSRDTVSTISEPISVGGAFLSCSLPAEQEQVGSSWQLGCQLNETDELKDSESVSADFTWVDAEGTRHPMVIESFEQDTFQWALLADRIWRPAMVIEASIVFDDSSPIEFKADISLPERVNLELNLDFWLGGEPNNLTFGAQTGENCGEMGNSAYRLDHIERTSLASDQRARLNDAVCNLNKNALCRHSKSSTGELAWVLGDTQVSFEQALTACPQGYEFSMPLTENEWLAVSNLLDGVDGVYSVWIALDDRESEGIFTTSFKH